MGATDFETRPAQDSDLADVLAQLDAEFVTGKGRTLSLGSRFPSVYAAGQAVHILIARAGSRLVGVVATKRRTWREGGQTGDVVMIGGVYTSPDMRGRGVASRLLQEAVDTARRSGAAAAVLWTGIQDFYGRLGWQVADGGRFGRLLRAPGAAPVDVEVSAPVDAAGSLEQLREQWLPARLARLVPLDYRAVPLPAVETCVWRTAGDSSYVLFGVQGPRAFVYELVGEERDVPGLLSGLAGAFGEVWINDRHGSTLSRWTEAHPEFVTWSDQSQTMWQTWPGGWRLSDAAKVCISYFDRI